VRIGIPHYGMMWVLWQRFFEPFGVEVVIPPLNSKRSLDLGTRHCPEMLCVPCKLLFGNYVEALEMGIDDLALLGGQNTCRLGYSVQTAAERLRELGYSFRPHSFDIFKPQTEIYRLLRELANPSLPVLVQAYRSLVQKVNLVEDLEKLAHRTRARELKRGQTSAVYQELLPKIAQAWTSAELASLRREAEQRYQAVARRDGPEPLRIAIVGDPYSMSEPFFNLGLEEDLGHLGVEVHRGFWLSNFTRETILDRLRDRTHYAQVQQAAAPYVRWELGIFARQTVGEAVLFARQGFDGLIHLAPFTCTPETVARDIVPRVARDYGVPLLTLSLDEHTGRSGQQSRLEAFVDVLERRRAKERLAPSV